MFACMYTYTGPRLRLHICEHTFLNAHTHMHTQIPHWHLKRTRTYLGLHTFTNSRTQTFCWLGCVKIFQVGSYTECPCVSA